MTRDHLKSDEVIKTSYLNPGIGHRSPIIPPVYNTIYIWASVYIYIRRMCHIPAYAQYRTVVRSKAWVRIETD